jgi:hypothetical protein
MLILLLRSAGGESQQSNKSPQRSPSERGNSFVCQEVTRARLFNELEASVTYGHKSQPTRTEPNMDEPHLHSISPLLPVLPEGCF